MLAFTSGRPGVAALGSPGWLTMASFIRRPVALVVGVDCSVPEGNRVRAWAHAVTYGTGRSRRRLGPWLRLDGVGWQSLAFPTSAYAAGGSRKSAPNYQQPATPALPEAVLAPAWLTPRIPHFVSAVACRLPLTGVASRVYVVASGAAENATV